jgi:hypothetical protein
MPPSFHRLTAYALVALGTVHALLATGYGAFSPDAVWFAGTGLALVFLGLLNVAAVVAASRPVWTLCRVANVLGLGLGVAGVRAVPEPQAYAGLLLLLALLVGSLAARVPRKIPAEPGVPDPP